MRNLVENALLNTNKICPSGNFEFFSVWLSLQFFFSVHWKSVPNVLLVSPVSWSDQNLTLILETVSVYYVAVRTIVLSRHRSNLAKPVIIHGLIYVPSTPHCGFFGDSPDGNFAYDHRGSFTSNWKSVRQAIWFTWLSEPHDTPSLHSCPSVYSTWLSQAVTHLIINRARRCLTSVIEPTPMS